MKHISILGSTGSIGEQTLSIVREHPDKFKVVGLSCYSNIEKLQEQIKEFNPEVVGVMDKDAAEIIKTDSFVFSGIEGLKEVAKAEKTDTVVNALVGSIGVEPTMTAIKENKNIALANKETLVTAGEVIMDAVSKHNCDLMPIDSEHSAIFQCLNGEDPKKVKKIILTCSGGPFKHHTPEQMKTMTAKDALKHPTWNMGAKITIDSATLMNKGFEVIETHHLYKTPYDKIEVVIHPQSIVHSFVEFEDRSQIAQVGEPNMMIPIQYALSYPTRISNSLPSYDITKTKELTFTEPDLKRFPCLAHAYEAGTVGGSLPAVMNAANEVAVQAFLDGQITFLEIPSIIKQEMDEHSIIKNPELDELLTLDKKTKLTIKERINPKN